MPYYIRTNSTPVLLRANRNGLWLCKHRVEHHKANRKQLSRGLFGADIKITFANGVLLRRDGKGWLSADGRRWMIIVRDGNIPQVVGFGTIKI